ncbi:Retinol-binding protein pinta [Formica fusca]
MMDSQNCNNVIHNLTVEQKEYAAKVLNETDENRENAIAEIKRWIQESDLRSRTDDFFILRFLRTCKFNIENTKKRLQNFQKLRANHPEWYANIDPLHPKLQELLDLGICLPLRKLDDQGRMVIIARLVHNPDIFTLSDVIKIFNMIAELAIRDSVETSLYGFVIIADFGHITLHHIAQMRPRIVMNALYAWQGCYPVRIKSLNFINVLDIAKALMIIIRYFLNDKLKQRLHIYTCKTMHDCFINMPANILPVEYGGTDGTIQELTEFWKKVVEENRDWFIDDEKYVPIS